jgi:hypothetical protein
LHLAASSRRILQHLASHLAKLISPLASRLASPPDLLQITSTHLRSPSLTSAHLYSPPLTSAHLRSPPLTSAHLRSPPLTSAHVGSSSRSLQESPQTRFRTAHHYRSHYKHIESASPYRITEPLRHSKLRIRSASTPRLAHLHRPTSHICPTAACPEPSPSSDLYQSASHRASHRTSPSPNPCRTPLVGTH